MEILKNLKTEPLISSLMRSVLEFGSVIWSQFYRLIKYDLDNIQYKFLKISNC